MAKLRELMNTSVVSTTPDCAVAEAAARMVEASVGSAVIMQGAFLAGILTEREDLRESVVSEWMTPDPQSAGPDATAEEAAQIMLRGGFRHLPVLEGREVRGVVSLRELFAARIRR
jgi:CBS domain-containing protein